MKEKILVIIVTFNGIKWIDKCLSSLLKSKHQVDVIVIDNGSTDGTQNFIKQSYPRFKLIQTQTNLGFGGANNIGLKYAIDQDYDYVYLLNQDAWIFPDTVPNLINVSKLHKDFGIISPMQYSGDEIKLDPGFQMVFDCNNNTNEDLIEVPFIMAAHWFIPCNSIKKIGGFSPTFFHYGEDNNMIDRIHFHGLKVGIYKKSKAVHDRYDRPVSKDKLIYLKKTSNLIRMSSPLKPLWQGILTSFFLSIFFSLKLFDITPFLDYIKILTKLRDIKSNRLQSINKGTAFI